MRANDQQCVSYATGQCVCDPTFRTMAPISDSPLVSGRSADRRRLLQRRRRPAEEQRVDTTLVLTGDYAQLSRQDEGHQKVGRRHE